MYITNYHNRIFDQPRERLSALVETLATETDQLWPAEHWPPMQLSEGLAVGSIGGHGPIRYSIEEYRPGEFVKFVFSAPRGFDGFHSFSLSSMPGGQTKLLHSVEMHSTFRATLLWIFGIRWLHDALVEDALDKAENHFTGKHKRTEWSPWVKFLRKRFSGKRSPL